MSKKRIYFIMYPFERDDKGIPDKFLLNDKKLTEAILSLPLSKDIEVYKTQQNVKVTNKGYYVACYESDVILDNN